MANELDLEAARQQLAECRAAISAVLTGGQALGVNGRQVTRGDLAELRAMETALERKVRRLTGGTGRRVTRIVPLG